MNWKVWEFTAEHRRKLSEKAFERAAINRIFTGEPIETHLSRKEQRMMVKRLDTILPIEYFIFQLERRASSA
jgi:hypothetical protein